VLKLVLRALAALLLVACQRPSESPPAASFLVIAGDSTFWVESDGQALATRRSSLMLASVEGRLHELYIADEDLSYYDALLVGQRVYRRDLITGDSMLIRHDTSITALARAYAARHPRERPLAPDEDTADEPSTQASTETELLDVIGPYLSYEYHLDVDINGERDQHITQRGVLDIRDGRRVRVDDLATPEESRRVYAEGRRQFLAAVDSIRRARDERASRALSAISGFAFDSSSFELTDADRHPAVAFLVPGRGLRAGGYALPLGDIPLKPSSWWTAAATALPTRSDDRTAVWEDSAYQVTAHADPGATSATIEVSHGATRWVAGTVPLPVRRLFRVPADTATRHSLARAFDEVEAYAGLTRTSTSAKRTRARRLPSPIHPSPEPQWTPGLHPPASRSSPTS
jgi:hypothetical protein